MPAAEREAKWITYKHRMVNEFDRAIKGQFSGEKKFIQRHTDPMAYLKYKLGRNHSLDPKELDKEQMQYYQEIGGKDDVQELLLIQSNIDSLSRTKGKLPRKRRHEEMLNLADSNNSSVMSTTQTDNSHNHNRNHNRSGSQDIDLSFDEDYDLDQDIMPSLLSQRPLQEASEVKTEKMNNALNVLSGGFEEYEQELLDKKKKETFELTQEKMRSVEEHTAGLYRNKPEMIGAMMGASPLEDQLNIAFDFWVKDNMTKIKEKVFDLEDFWNQILMEREDLHQWNKNLAKWKFKRIVLGNDFDVSWNFIVGEFHVEERLVSPEHEIIQNDIPAESVIDEVTTSL